MQCLGWQIQNTLIAAVYFVVDAVVRAVSTSHTLVGFLNRGSPAPVLAVVKVPPTHFCAVSKEVVTVAVVNASLIYG